MTTLAELDGLVKRYGDATVVDCLRLTVPEGAVFGLLGPNGAGKTTSIKVLLGLARASAGHVELLGEVPGSPGFPAALRQVGSLIEGPALFARASARDNLRIEAAARRLAAPDARIDEMLELVGLAHRADSPAGSFSLGMRQRLGLAIALLASPRLVVLDEPTNGLDPAGIVEIRELIRELPARGTTVLVSSHLLAEVQLMCDRAAILHHGRRGDGRPGRAAGEPRGLHHRGCDRAADAQHGWRRDGGASLCSGPRQRAGGDPVRG